AEDGKKFEQVDVLGEGDLLPRRLCSAVHRNRELLPAFLEFEELFFDGAGFGHSEHECGVGPGAVDVEGPPSGVESVDVLEEQGGGGLSVQVGGGSAGRPEVAWG